MQKLFAVLFLIVLLGLAKGTKTGCWSAVEDKAGNLVESLGDLVESFDEGEGLSVGASADLVDDLTYVCNSCFDDCLWIDTLDADINCAILLYNEFTSAVEIADSWGLDIFAEWDFLKNLYTTYTTCKTAVDDTEKIIDDGDDDLYIAQTSQTDDGTYDGLPSVIMGKIHVYHGDIDGQTLQSPFLYIASDSSDELPNGFEAASFQLGDSDTDADVREWILNSATEYMQEINQPDQYPATRLVCTSYDGNGDTAINVNCSLDELAAGKWQCGYYSQCVTEQDIMDYWFPLGPTGNCIAPAVLVYADAHPNAALQLVGGCANLKKESLGTETQNLQNALDDSATF